MSDKFSWKDGDLTILPPMTLEELDALSQEELNQLAKKAGAASSDEGEGEAAEEDESEEE